MSVPKDSLKKHERLPYIFGGKLHEEYEIEGLHFHWGDKNNRGSEHLLNDIRYPMEMHIIHRNRRYATVPEALGHEDGLCVLGFFYQISERESDVLTNIVRNLSSVEDYNKTVLLNSTFSLSSLLGNIDTDRFYTYRGNHSFTILSNLFDLLSNAGSLTTPPCSEAVRWVLFPDTLPLTISQISAFRQLSNGIEGSVLVDNYRALQPIGNRRVFVRKVNIKNTKLSAMNNEVHYSKWDWLY